MNKKSLFGMTASGLLMAFLIGTVLYRALEDDEATKAASVNQAVLVRDHAPMLGKADAPVTIVEFIDPACETCRTFYPLVKEMLAKDPDRIRLLMRYTPFHAGAPDVVAVLEATRKQGKYWQALEALLTRQHEWTVDHHAHVDLVWMPLEGLGLDLARVRTDMKDPAIAKNIAQDQADAKTLNVTKTPEYFVNGKPLPTFGYEPLERLVDAALAKAH